MTSPMHLRVPLEKHRTGSTKVEGRMALVLPKALLSGVAWQETRHLFRLRYQLEYLIVSHDPGRWNFSENTDLSEVLVIARKTDTGGSTPAGTGRVTCVNLWKNPATAVEALGIAHAIAQGEPPDLESGQGALEVMLGDTKAGEAVSVPWGGLRDGLWMPPCAFAQSDVLRAAHHLCNGALYLPGRRLWAPYPCAPWASWAHWGQMCEMFTMDSVLPLAKTLTPPSGATMLQP